MRRLIEGSDGGWWVYYTSPEKERLAELLGREINVLPTSYSMDEFTASKVREITLHIGVTLELPERGFMVVGGKRVPLLYA